MAYTSHEVARYYDRNTDRFLRLGQGGTLGVLHRAVWGPGVTTRSDAFHFVHDLVVDEIHALDARAEPPTLLDLGCGIGASLLYLVERTGARGTGITNSTAQLQLARSLHDGVAETDPRPHFVCGDFCRADLPSPVHLAYAIEAFVHAADPRAFFDQVATHLEVGGRLVVCDDFLEPDTPRASSWARAAVDEFRRDWRLSALMTPNQADRLAADAGLSLLTDRDLSDGVEMDRPRDRILSRLIPLGRAFHLNGPRWLSLAGGDALRRCLKAGLIQYRYRVWEKTVQ